MFSVKHNQSPRSQPSYKPRGPPQSIPAGWVTYHCGLTTEQRWAEPSRAERGGRQRAESWCRREVRPVGDLPARQWPICYEPTRGKMGARGGNLVERPWCFTSYLHHLSSNPRECVNVAKVIKFMVVLKWFFSPPSACQETRGYPWESFTSSKECKAKNSVHIKNFWFHGSLETFRAIKGHNYLVQL